MKKSAKRHSCGGELVHRSGRRWVCTGCLLPFELGESRPPREEIDISCGGTIHADRFET